MTQTLDITPSPRVLRMLGQIDFAPWQCLAELIDNSVDAFIGVHGPSGVSSPRIAVSLPSPAELDGGRGTLIVEDNGPGMSLDQLGNAVKAGYSGNDPVGKMGLFGMGFNISTARLGRRTAVWTAEANSPDWVGVVIDFDDLERRGSFQAPISLRPKSANELESRAHGTRIEISRLEPDRARPLIWGGGKARAKQRLGKIYGRVMSTLGITLSYDGDHVKPWRHCVWSPSRSVPTPDFGNVPARIEIDEALPPRRFCTTCWVWLDADEHACSACGLPNNIIERQRRLKGWIGVQRYFDKEHYGIDLVRNGRVIEELDKSLFTYRDPNGDELFEYPRDAVHWGGRIVGELDIDFVRVSHQKDSFDKLDPEWKHVVSCVRGESPLQPMIADRMGLSRNRSPLARLFAGYRKGIAGLKSLVPGDASGVGINTGILKDYVDRFYAGEQAYQDDEKWYDLVKQVERAARGSSDGARQAAGPVLRPAPPAGPPPGSPQQNQPASATPAEPDPELSRTYDLDILGSLQSVSVSARRRAARPEDPPFSLRATGIRLEFEYDPRAELFEETLATPTDLLLVDLAQHFLAVAGASPRDLPVSLIAYRLRKKYFPRTLTDVSAVADEAEAFLDELRTCYDEALPSAAPIDSASLPGPLVARIRQAAFHTDGARESDVASLIVDGKFARYLDNSHLLTLVERWPSLVLDGAFLSRPYQSVNVDIRRDSLDTLLDALRDVLWLADEASGAVSKDKAWRLRYGRALASLRLIQSWRA